MGEAAPETAEPSGFPITPVDEQMKNPQPAGIRGIIDWHAGPGHVPMPCSQPAPYCPAWSRPVHTPAVPSLLGMVLPFILAIALGFFALMLPGVACLEWVFFKPLTVISNREEITCHCPPESVTQ